MSDSRIEYQGSDVYSQNFGRPLFLAAASGIEHAGAYYYGYKLRNKDTYDEHNLAFGSFTFYSILT